MNDQPLYELQIAAKLEQLPLPDMADAIWLRIKNQLDADMPDNGGHTPPPPPPVTPVRARRGGRAGLVFIVLVAVVTVIWLLPKQQKKQLPAAPPLTDSVVADTGRAPASLPQTTTKPPAGNSPLPVTPAPQQQNNILPLTMPDSKPSVAGPVPDSTSVLPPLPLLLPPPAMNKAPQKQKDSIPPKKLSRGMPGITDSDYKIVPKPRE